MRDVWASFVDLLPKTAGAIVVLAIGWVAGRLIGKGLSRVLDRAGADDVVRGTAFGKALERSGFTIVRFFDAVTRWFIYLVAIFAAVNILDMPALSAFMRSVVEYLPSFIGGVIILILGFLIADKIGDAVASVGRGSKMEFSGIVAAGLKLLLYFVVVAMALRTMRIDVEILYIFAQALAWGAAVGIAVGLGIAVGWGFKDAVAKRAGAWLSSTYEAASKAEELWNWYNRRTPEEHAL